SIMLTPDGSLALTRISMTPVESTVVSWLGNSEILGPELSWPLPVGGVERFSLHAPSGRKTAARSRRSPGPITEGKFRRKSLLIQGFAPSYWIVKTRLSEVPKLLKSSTFAASVTVAPLAMPWGTVQLNGRVTELLPSRARNESATNTESTVWICILRLARP